MNTVIGIFSVEVLKGAECIITIIFSLFWSKMSGILKRFKIYELYYISFDLLFPLHLFTFSIICVL